MRKAQKHKEISFCAFCRSPHRFYAKKGIGIFHLSVSILLTVSFMWGFWGEWSPKAIPILLVCLFLGEFVSHFRWRLALVCRQCGFDPLIYQRSPATAALRVKAFLLRRKSEPQFLLAPAINLPKQPRNSLKL